MRCFWTGITDPMMNFIFPALAVLTIVGMHSGSLGPNKPWGRMATVSSSGLVSPPGQLAANTSCKQVWEGNEGMSINNTPKDIVKKML